MTTGLELRSLCIRQGDRILVDLNVSVGPGEVLTVMGPSGSGKSTLLFALIGALAPEFVMTGSIWLDGCEITAVPTPDRRVGILFQDTTLFAHLSVGGNLAFALPASVKGRAARREQIEAALRSAGLEGFADRDPETLSGGQRARVALMRTLLASPMALLLDEPFSKLDADRRAHIRSFVIERIREQNLPGILVTHDQDDADAMGGPILSPLG